mgnify:CR=1 FL=1
MKFFLLVPIFFLTSELPAEYIEGLQVLEVIDGDTVHASLEGVVYKIRLTEIDAPERDQPFGNESRVYLNTLLADGVFAAKLSGQDRYGRYLGKLYENGIDINRKMVAEGLAWVYDDYVTDKSFYKNQETAMENGKGMWSDSGSIPPWKWRNRRRLNLLK